MKRGDIFWADLTPRSGSEQTGRRLVLIVSHDGFNTLVTWRSLLVVPLSTSASQANRGPTVVEVPNGIGGLSRTGYAICHQVTTLDRAKLARRIGSLPAGVLKSVEEALKAALDLD